MDLKRVQKAAIGLIKGGNHEDGLLRANQVSKLCKTFAIKCMKSENPRINNFFSKKT